MTEKKKSFIQNFLHNFVIVAIINSVLAVLFLKQLDNVANPFGLLVSVSLVCAVVVTLIRRKQTI